jgi:hypothetical protein
MAENTSGVTVDGVNLPRELVSRVVEHLQTQATYTPSERNQAALLAVAGELLTHVSGVPETRHQTFAPRGTHGKDTQP